MDEFTPSLEHRVQEFLRREEYRPMKQHELAQALKLKGGARAELRHALREMERKGQVIRLRKNRWSLPDSSEGVIGIFRTNLRGFGFVSPDDPSQADIFIPAKHFGIALHGDRVMASLLRIPPSRRRGAGGAGAPKLEGRIERILERGAKTLVGLLQRTPYYAYVIPDDARFLHDVRLRAAPEIRFPPAGHKVVVELQPWSNPEAPLYGAVIEDLGAADAPGVDMVALLRSRRLDPDFPSDAEREARQHPPTPPPEAISARRDLRDLLAFTIDPEDAHDFDDAVSLSRYADGTWLLGVHIADVSHFVPPGSALDEEALSRGNSVYLVDRVITMLPRFLTTEICSLQPEQERLTHTAQLILNDQGDVLHAETFPATIRSRARLAYDEVQTLFDSGAAPPGMPGEVATALGDMRGLARILRARRVAAGSIDFVLPEIKCELDARGDVIAVHKRGAREAYQLIEEFMLVANRAVALRLSGERLPGLFRVHDTPDETQWSQIAADLEALGIDALPESREELQAIAHRVLGTPLEYAAQLAMLRNFKRAHYSAERREHFGLAFTHYTHFTSPIRRYPDLLVHRILKAVEARAVPPYSTGRLAEMAAHCSRTERDADEAEEESVEMKRVQYYERLLWNGHIGPFPGMVVGIVSRGLIVELADTLQRGLAGFRHMPDDFYQMSPDRTQAVGRRHRAGWRIGDRVTVELARVDYARRQLDFRLASPPRRVRRHRVSE